LSPTARPSDPTGLTDARKAAERRHGEAIAPRAEAVWGWDTPAGRLRAARRGHLLAQDAGLVAGTRVLELGCGTGVFTRQWAALGAALLAVDISVDLLLAGLAQERAAPSPHPLDAAGAPGRPPRRAAMDVEALGLRAESFDAVMGVSVLHHVDLPHTLAEIRRVLRPGGRIAFSEPNMLNPQIALQKNIPFIKRLLGDTPHETAFTRWGLASHLRRHGFTDIRIAPFDFLHPLTPRRAIPLVSRIAAAAERAPILREIAGSLRITAIRP
jgi:SAM-dependent methyltransferase